MHRREFHRRVTAAVLTGGVLGSSPVLGQTTPAPTAQDKLPIIDTHQHLWDLDRQRVPWLEKGKGVLGRSYRISDYVETTRPWNVVKAIYMEIDVAPSDENAEVELITELCRSGKYPTVAAVIGGRPGETSFADYIRTHAKNQFVRGVRQVLHGATPRGYCLQETFVASMKLLGELGLSFDICVRPDELPDAVELVGRCPETRFIVDHCGNADPKAFLPAARRNEAAPSHDPDVWRRAMAALGKAPNTICKISGIVAQVPKPTWTAEDLAPVVNHCLNSFGPERVVFGSDWPVCRTGGAELGQWIAALQGIVKDRPEAERRKLFHDNAQAFYRV
jgi:L-fuconolactonase